jgi:Flp pilus assembly protein TadG
VLGFRRALGGSCGISDRVRGHVPRVSPGRLRDDNGQSLVEFAMVLPILLTVALGIIVFGNLYRDHQQVTGAVAAAARFEAICNGANTGDATTIGTAAATGLSPAPTFTYNDLTTGNPLAPHAANCGIAHGDQIKVTGQSTQSVNLFIWHFGVKLTNSVTVTEQ